MTNAEERFFEERFPINGDRISKIINGLKQHSSTNTQAGLPGLKRSNTTVFTFTYEGGVIIAGDRRMSSDFYEIASDSATKIKQLTKHSAMACAGLCSVVKYLEENMENACNRLLETYGINISPDGQANYMERLLEGWFSWILFTGYWFVGLPILAAYDTDQNKGRIFSFYEDGFSFEPKVVAGTGCGFGDVRGLLLDRWHPRLTQDEAVELATRAMFFSGITSHGVSDSRTSVTQISTIDKRGYINVSPEVVKSNVSKILNEHGGRTWELT